MMKRYITADLHFNHEVACGPNAFVSTRRNISNIDEMRKVLMDAHNRKVKREDTTYILGDGAVNVEEEVLFTLLSQLNGQIIVIKGNNDSKKGLKYLEDKNFIMEDGREKFITHEVGCIIEYNGLIYYLLHYPLDIGQGPAVKNHRAFCGHIHEEVAPFPNCFNVGVDSPELPKDRVFGEPIEFKQACEWLENKIAASK